MSWAETFAVWTNYPEPPHNPNVPLLPLEDLIERMIVPGAFYNTSQVLAYMKANPERLAYLSYEEAKAVSAFQWFDTHERDAKSYRPEIVVNKNFLVNRQYTLSDHNNEINEEKIRLRRAYEAIRAKYMRIHRDPLFVYTPLMAF
jgi:hypothetical protein